MLYDLTVPNDTNPLGMRGLTTTVTAASDEVITRRYRRVPERPRSRR